MGGVEVGWGMGWDVVGWEEVGGGRLEEEGGVVGKWEV